MIGIVAYCRAGFEGDCAAELQAKTAAMGVYGYCQTQPDSGYVMYRCASEEADHLGRKLALNSLIFTRQFFVVANELNELPEHDRVSPMLAVCAELPLMGSVRVETADTNEGRELSTFCRKFTVPLRQALRKQQCLTDKESSNRPTLHVLFINKQQVLLGYSYSYNQSPWLMGIPRLRSPSDAPSRSTLKLDEAFSLFVPAEEHATRLQSGLKAVDLGAAPGGWTYQLVRRGMMVEAVDNGPMAESLMETGQVKHVREDGFRYRPKKFNVTWLVCDMVEKPARVGELMTAWLLEGYCKEAIFNLKLPMKRRYAAVEEYLERIQHDLSEGGHGRFEINAKHLYHDREEITVHVRWL
ncbi:23S rRNA (cytidine(2498)-2'-O)-methyltransferase RlmM [Idiomarina xiamenensis]|uniref:Ribosomal RNA large subunit methyltransferase M n=1 Tax=Idiomarina xiamenensis 10-D-4 TaxID=740709 RepID=K2JMX7_9GAMM|nr:23S rRNA (cytidine(2498)-2'-O)-methyltransferase RlmM [Idiomarina xiamenensis]EKE84871.1 23S rRNA C2498 ribose 2'-O-ribose methyltransferase [Idiomarina xiamenensis 10-D-4]